MWEGFFFKGGKYGEGVVFFERLFFFFSERAVFRKGVLRTEMGEVLRYVCRSWSKRTTPGLILCMRFPGGALPIVISLEVF